MSWEMFYLTCFGLGLALTVVSLMGGFHHHLHFGLHRGLHRRSTGKRCLGSSSRLLADQSSFQDFHTAHRA